MDRKIIIIGVIVVIAALLVGGYLFLNSNEAHNDRVFFISKSAYMKVPDSNATHKPDKHGVYYYVDKENGINVTSCNSNISKESSVSVMKKLKDSTEANSKKTVEDGVVIYEKNGTYSIFVDNLEYNNTVILQSTNKALLLSCWKTLKFHDPNEVIKVENITSSSTSSSINAVEETQDVIGDVSASSSSTSSSSSSSSDTSYSDTSYTTSGDSWSYGGYSSTNSKSSEDFVEYDFSG